MAGCPRLWMAEQVRSHLDGWLLMAATGCRRPDWMHKGCTSPRGIDRANASTWARVISPAAERSGDSSTAATPLSGMRRADPGGPVAVVAPPSQDALDVLSGLLRDTVLRVERGTATRGDVDTAMRLGAGHPA